MEQVYILYVQVVLMHFLYSIELPTHHPRIQKDQERAKNYKQIKESRHI